MAYVPETGKKCDHKPGEIYLCISPLNGVDGFLIVTPESKCHFVLLISKSPQENSKVPTPDKIIFHNSDHKGHSISL